MHRTNTQGQKTVLRSLLSILLKITDLAYNFDPFKFMSLLQEKEFIYVVQAKESKKLKLIYALDNGSRKVESNGLEF